MTFIIYHFKQIERLEDDGPDFFRSGSVPAWTDEYDFPT
jgi:hypothetical protein